MLITRNRGEMAGIATVQQTLLTRVLTHACVTKGFHSITTSLSCHPEVGSTVSTGPVIVNRGGIKGCFKPPKTFINKVKTSLLMNECLLIAFYKIEFDIACYSAPYKVLAILFYFCFNELKL